MQYTVLVVDNHPMILHFVASVLERDGHTVLTAEDGLGALEVLKETTPDVVFIDLIMPNISGEKLCRILRQGPATRDLVLVVLSAIAAEQIIDVGEFGADLCIAKGPLDEIGNHVRQVMAAVADGSLDELRGSTLGADSIFVRKISQELLSSKRHAEAILAQMTEGILELDRAGRIIFANRAAISLFEEDSEEGLLAHPFVEFLHEVDRARIETMIDAAGPEPRATDEQHPVALRGRSLALRTFLVTDDDLSGTVVVILEDVTERRRMAGQLERTRNMEGLLAGAVAHELNNILGGVVGYPDLMLLELPSDDAKRMPLMAIKRAGLKATAVVQDLLSLARRGHQERDVLDLDQVVTAVLNNPEGVTFMSRFPEVELRTELAGDLEPVAGSMVQLSTALMNLVFNAVESIGGSGTVEVVTANQRLHEVRLGFEDVPPGTYVTVSVSDSGEVVDREEVERIFEPFFTKKVLGRSGTGLGMAVLWGTIKDHEGYIDVTSTEGRGTTFTLFLPVCAQELTAPRTRPEIADLQGNDERLLVVDDVAEQAEVAVAMLQQLGYRATAVASGEAAVERARQEPHDLVLLDMIMAPGIDGLETFRRLRRIRPDQRVLIVSGYADSDRVVETLRLGAGGCLKKPFTIKDLGAAVRAELDPTGDNATD